MMLCFTVDRTLGRLAKWLRILGYDTICELDVSGKSFFENMQKDRILITRTQKILRRFTTQKIVFITSNYLDEQLKQVIDETGISRKDIRLFSRCTHCNLPIVVVGKDDIFGLVPDYILETHDEFHRCRQCERVYWRGSHAQRSTEMINKILSSRHY